jgi:hypothetical protein
MPLREFSRGHGNVQQGNGEDRLFFPSDEPSLRCERIESRVGKEGSGGIKFDFWRTSVPAEGPVPPDLIDTPCQVHDFHECHPFRRVWSFSRSRAWQLIKSVMRDAGIPPGPHASPKGLRHSFGIHAIRCGVPINLVQRWLGHASMTTTAIYLQAMGREERAFAARMWARDGDTSAASHS